MRENSIFGDHLGGFSVCIHRGARQIGGTCIELACEDQRILLDLGLPLDAGDEDPTSLLPENDGLKVADPSLLALIVSNHHGGRNPPDAAGGRTVRTSADPRWY